MKKIWIIMGLALNSMTTYAIDCPAKAGEDNFLEKVSASIKASQSCDDAVSVAETCALGASGDTETAAVAERKCGLDFWKKLSKTDKQHYNALQDKCNHKFKNMDGTMYISMNAFCRLHVAKLYSELYSAAE